MRMRLSMNIGFVTNSSFAVHHFPRALLEHPTVKAFIEAYEISQGFIGRDVWSRNACGTVAMTRDQKRQVVEAFGQEEDFHAPGINVESDEVLIIYGDEHQSLARGLAGLMIQAAEAMNLDSYRGEYH